MDHQYIEQSPLIHKILNWWRTAFLVINLIALFVLIFLENNYGSTSQQVPGMIWLMGMVFLRSILIIRNCWNPVYSRCVDCVIWAYNFISVFWHLLGTLCFATALVFLFRNFENKQSGIWLMIIGMYIIDTGNILCYISFKHDVLREQGEHVPVRVVDQSKVVTHLFYHRCEICQENFKDGEDVRELECTHIFHPGCIEGKVCPVCV